jgi:predicted Zn finger-like uncharacterized protein
MKFNCPSCSAKYQIADDKLTGRLAKMKCRKCGTLIPIVAEPSHKTPGADSVRRAATIKPEVVAFAPPSLLPQLEAQEWHAGIKGKPVGPLSRSEVATRIRSGDISAETYVWRDGMDGWKVLPEVPQLSDLLKEAPELLPPPSMPARAKQQGAAPPRAAKKPPVAAAVAAPKVPQAPTTTDGVVLLGAPKSASPKPAPVKPAALIPPAFSGPPAASAVPAVSPTAPVSAAPPRPIAHPAPVAPGQLTAAQQLAASFGLDIESSRAPEIKESTGRIEAVKEIKRVDFDSAVPALITEAPAPDIAMPKSSAKSSLGIRPTYESLVAELKRRKKRPWVVPFAVTAALVLGVSLGFVLFGGQETKVIKEVVEVQAQAAVPSAESTTSLGEIPPPPELGEGTTTNVGRVSPGKKVTTGGAKSEASPAPTEISKGLKGLAGLDGLGGPSSGPSTTTGASSGQQLESSQIQSTVTTYQSGVKRGCWQPALMSRAKDAPSTARVTVSIGVAPNGSVTSASSSGDPRGYPGLASCITTRVRAWRFPVSGGSTTVNVPFVFAAQ